MKADYNFVAIGANQVMVTSGGVERFASQWPCSGMRFDDDLGVIFSFESNGDLCDIEWFDGDTGLTVSEPDGVNGEALNALSQNAQEYLKAVAA